MTNDTLLRLSTKIKEPKKFQVDGQEYQLLGIDHLSPTDESEVMALFARHALLNAELESTANVQKGKLVADKMKVTRLQVITKLTDLPKTVAEKLPLSAQVRLLETIQAEVEADVEDDDADLDSDDDAPPDES